MGFMNKPSFLQVLFHSSERRAHRIAWITFKETVALSGVIRSNTAIYQRSADRTPCGLWTGTIEDESYPLYVGFSVLFRC